MERQQSNLLQNFDDPKSEILKKRLLKATSASATANFTQNNSQNNVLLNTLRAPISSSMLVSSVQAPQSSMPITHNLVTHSIAPVKIHANNSHYPLQLSTVHVPVQIPGSTSNINVPVQLSGATSSVPLQIAPMQDQGVQMKMSQAPVSQVQVGSNSTIVQIPNSSSNSIQLTLPNSGGQGAVHLRGAQRPVPHVVYLQTPTGLKSFTSTDVISQASTSGNPPQIIVRRPVTSNSNINLISNVGQKPNIAPKVQGPNKSSILAPANPVQPIVIQKPKASDKVIVPVSIAAGNQGKQAIAYLSTVKKPTVKNVENQSILISSNQNNVNSVNSNNQKLFLTPMNMPKIQNTKFILPVTLPATMASKGPIINLQIANGQIQNDPQGNITVMRDTGNVETSDMPPLQPLQKIVSINGKESSVPQSPKAEKYATSILGSRAEPTGEQGEYTLSIPETNASMNDDIYTVSIADEEDGQTTEKSFTLAIPEKGKSLLNKNLIDRNDMGPVTVAAPAILRRSYSDNSDRKTINHNNVKRRISLCAENMSNKTFRLSLPNSKAISTLETDGNDDHKVPSLFCNEKLDKDLESKVVLEDSDTEEYREKIECVKNNMYSHKDSEYDKDDGKEFSESVTEEDPPGLVWINGVAQLRGSDLQFQTNEFGMIDLIQNENDLDHLTNPSAKYHTPLKQRIERSRDKKPTSPEDLYRCDGCGCHGMAAEFITPNFCSVTCQTENQKMLQKKKDRERIEMTKKRNKMKKLLMRKQTLEAEIGQENKDDKVALKQYDSAASDSQLSDANLVKMAEDMVENEKYPWMCGKNGFSWMRYLDVCKAKAAPVKLFKDPFPYSKNGFKLGMRLEAIDPEHPAMFCVVSVAEVQGYRMRLHFDEYPDMYDFWVNADSVDIFPPGWCDKNGRTLKPPASYVNTTFSWPMYLKQMRAIAAPRQLFPHITATNMKPNSFRVGMKLEAEERGGTLRVATVADMMDGRVLVRPDGGADFWADPACPYIHPVGWADEHGAALTPPKCYKEEVFSWEAYLAETMSTAAPPRAFKTRAPVGFKPGMKLEVVDKRVPFLIRVATVSAVRGHRVRVSFDGWPDELSCWLDDDSPDIHPVGWCLKTGHPLEPPLTAEELRIAGPCGVGGCRGLGSVRGGANKQHAVPAACPYRAPPPTRSDRLQPRPPSKPPKPIQSSTPTSDTQREKLPRGRPPKHKRVEEVIKNDPGSDDESLSSGGKRWRGSPAPRDPPSPARAVLARHMAELDLPDNPVLWSQKETAALVGRLGGAGAGAAAAAARLSGAELLMASCDELVACLRLRLGPAVKVHALVRHLRRRLT
ncbi:lethal(3)malignant brain tumor-like protein 3 isoform X2 [Aricia agestis]|uniref:lethal(3)malignant brain tumor-like protein 3 isoform X2 n=1 Tax=Aricia agestis TaxID=91739 RepID=UPI001C2058E7|nr:lethal(3)malignant brain tumor-like protein 3 isoform X2 [Aricia agestis]